MKVEVDADELCKLREAASSRRPLRSEIDAVVSERDWWRYQARWKASQLDHHEDSVCEVFELEQAEGWGGHLALMVSSARSRGYEVPK